MHQSVHQKFEHCSVHMDANDAQLYCSLSEKDWFTAEFKINSYSTKKVNAVKSAVMTYEKIEFIIRRNFRYRN